MIVDWVWLVLLCTQVMIGESLPTNLMEDSKKSEQTMRPKPKRAQEMLMFGNQQNRQMETPSNSFTSNAEKRTLESSGLGGLKAALTEQEKISHAKSPSNGLYDRDTFSPYDKNYDYGKVLVKLDEMPLVWDVSPYSQYYMGEDRRKRSEKSATTSGSTTTRPSTTSFQVPTPTQQSVQAQVKRSVPIYQEPRFKREVEIDPEDVLTLLSLWENERRNRNWRKYMNDEYETEDEGNLLDEEDPRNALPWMDVPMYQSRHYTWPETVEALSPSDIGIVRTHPPSYYEQYGNQYGEQFENPSQYGTAPYDLAYPQRTYYNTPEKRFMVSRKRSQSYQPYTKRGSLATGLAGLPLPTSAGLLRSSLHANFEPSLFDEYARRKLVAMKLAKRKMCIQGYHCDREAY